MEQKFAESKVKIAQLLSEKKGLEEQLEMKDKLASRTMEHLQEIEKERDNLKKRFVSHFHPFPFTSLSPST
jgi:hypothetical protein